MDLKQLQLVVELAEAGSLSKLCAERGTVLSALSKQLAALEAEFSARLFRRTGRGLALNDFGESILPRIRSLLNEARLLSDEVASSADAPRGRVRLAVQSSLTHGFVGELFRRVRQDYPAVELTLMEEHAGKVQDTVASGRADIGVHAQYGTVVLRSDQLLGADALCVVSPAGDPRGACPSFAFHKLAGLPLIVLRSPDCLRPALEGAARQEGIALCVATEVDSLTAMTELVASGIGYALMNRQSAACAVLLGRVQASDLVDPCLIRSMSLAVSASRPLTCAGRAVVGVLREVAKVSAAPDWPART